LTKVRPHTNNKNKTQKPCKKNGKTVLDDDDRLHQYVILSKNQAYVKAVMAEYLNKGKARYVFEGDLSDSPPFKNCYGILVEVDAGPKCEVLGKDVLKGAKKVASQHGMYYSESDVKDLSTADALKKYALQIVNKDQVSDAWRNKKLSKEDGEKAKPERNKGFQKKIRRRGKRTRNWAEKQEQVQARIKKRIERSKEISPKRKEMMRNRRQEEE